MDLQVVEEDPEVTTHLGIMHDAKIACLRMRYIPAMPEALTSRSLNGHVTLIKMLSNQLENAVSNYQKDLLLKRKENNQGD